MYLTFTEKLTVILWPGGIDVDCHVCENIGTMEVNILPPQMICMVIKLLDVVRDVVWVPFSWNGFGLVRCLSMSARRFQASIMAMMAAMPNPDELNTVL